ncbi:MAG: biotin--[acetyl-CoA-carboxylase] ligase [Chthoniobacterales bacterium]
MSRVDALDADAIRAACAGQVVGGCVFVFDEVVSTNDVVAQMAASHAAGLVVLAERQTAGRGQYGRRWESAAGKGLWMSVLLRPRIPIAESARVTDLLACAIADTVTESTGLAATIKSPNDIYLAGRKVAGVLVEMRVEPGGGYCAAAGMGINLNHASDDFPPELRATAISLALATGRSVDRQQFAIALLRNLETQSRALTGLRPS